MTLSQQIRRDDTIRTLNNEYLTLPSNLGVRMTRESVQAIGVAGGGWYPSPTNWTAIIWTAAGEMWDTGYTPAVPGANHTPLLDRDYRMAPTTAVSGMWDSTNPTQIRAVKDGHHAVFGSFFITSTSQVVRLIGISICTNAAIVGWVAGASIPIKTDVRLIIDAQITGYSPLIISDSIWLKAGEYVELYAFHSHNAALNIIASPYDTPALTVVRVP